MYKTQKWCGLFHVIWGLKVRFFSATAVLSILFPLFYSLLGCSRSNADFDSVPQIQIRKASIADKSEESEELKHQRNVEYSDSPQISVAGVPSTPIANETVKDTFFGIHFDFLWATYSENKFDVSKAEDVSYLINAIEELNIGSIRLPIRWRTVFDDDGRVKKNSVSDIRTIIDAIPRDIEILIYLDSPSDYNRSVILRSPEQFEARYEKYISYVVERFKCYRKGVKIDDVEMRSLNLRVWISL